MRFGSKGFWLIVTGLAMVMILTVGIYNAEKSVANIKPVRQITLAGDIHYPPFEYQDGSVYKGFNVDIMKAVAAAEGWDIDFVPMAWKDAVTALENGTIDGIQGMVITPQFQADFDFSDPYLVQEQRIFVNDENQVIQSLADLKNARVVVQEGRVSEQIATDLGIANLVKVADQHEALDLLALNKVDAVLGNDLAGMYWEQEPGNQGLIKTVGETIKLQNYALAVHKGNTELLQEFNEGLQRISEEGTYEEIQRFWFGQVVMEKPLLSNTLIRAIFVAAGLTLSVGLLIIAWNRTLTRQVRKSTADLAAKNEELHQLVEQVIFAFGQAVEVKDEYTRHHSDRVALLARELAQETGADAEKGNHIFQAGMLHDIGKIGISERILNKRGKLALEEYTLIKSHPELGCAILADIPYCYNTGIVEMIKHHHERWDGSGYPDGLKGEQIIFGARILALADAWDAMTSNRAYRPAMSTTRAIEELRRGAGNQFDPDLVEPFIRCVVKDIEREYTLETGNPLRNIQAVNSNL